MDKATNDPAQILASLLETGQELMRRSFASATGGGQPAGGADPAGQWMEATKAITEMQQDYLKQVTGFWTAAMGGANPWQAMGGANPWQAMGGANPWLPASTTQDGADKRFAGRGLEQRSALRPDQAYLSRLFEIPRRLGRSGARRRSDQGPAPVRGAPDRRRDEPRQLPCDESRGDAARRGDPADRALPTA